ncbi:hypothetical protein [Paenibacillus borealis]|uniref:Uncharacterized protein n=1 Tax=Paenibacillus borealis TaxID=160799 RepID=A0A089MNZ8_PAEBO|nr:hypothetical protein [Paenibacillus borealis]AIQ58239.1 hypothetical protein PBOR_15840 [Paenibacillus borealis]
MEEVNSMSNTGTAGEYRQAALGSIEVLELCLEKFAFTELTRQQMNQFFRLSSGPAEAENITRRISGVYMAFLSKTNFKLKTAESNSLLFTQLKQELEEIKTALRELD